jgi:diguanylate cyclase (GGDEF)-like protein
MNSWIVVVDDEALSLTNAREILASEGMKVSCLRSGKDLIKFIHRNTPDLILMDVLMPDMDGFETFRQLRQTEDELCLKRTPVIFLTGEGDSETERRGLAEGASDFVHKPINKNVLLGRITNVIDNSNRIKSLTEEASLDKLTGFLNKSSGTAKITRYVRENDGALMVIDLDNFKLVNDLYGHDMGDRVLEEFAKVVKRNIRDDDVISRVGGDEFMGFFTNLHDKSAVESIVTRLNNQFYDSCEELMGEGFNIPIGISVGVVFVPEYGRDYKILFQYADGILYKVKQNGKHGYDIYGETITFDGEFDIHDQMERLTRLVEERGIKQGAMFLGQDAFTSSYRYIIRMITRNKRHALKVLFSLSPVNADDSIEDTVYEFGEVFKNNLRKCDIIMLTKERFFFMLLPDFEDDEAAGVIERVLNLWNENELSKTVKVDYITENI